MRKAVSLASSYRRKRLPASLMLRLELMQHLAHEASGLPPPQPRPREPRQGAPAIILAWFSLGVLASGAMGAGAIVGLRGLAAGMAPAAGTPAVASWSYPGAEWDTVQLAIDRSQRARAPLDVQVTGADASGFEVVLHGLPAGVRPSRGLPVGAATWVLKQPDLDGLHLTLDERAPESFDVKLAVLTSPGIPTAGSIVQVRLVDPIAPKPEEVAASDAPLSPIAQADLSDEGPGDDTARLAPAATPAPARTATTRGGDKAAGQPAQRRTAPAVASTGTGSGRTMPEGAYALGATSREPERSTSWWQMPPPSWSPFLVGQERP
jgi:hypothetical protein